MKILATLFIASLIWTPAVIAQNKPDKYQAELVGPVKTVEASFVDFALRDGKMEQVKQLPWYSAAYNPDGNIVERTSYDHLGNISARYTHTYDPKGRSTGYEEYSAFLDKTLKTPRKHIYSLDDMGNRVEYRVYDSDGSLAQRFTYKYDAKGNKIEDGYYYHTGQFGGKTVYTFDDKGHQTSQAHYGADAAFNWKNVSTYDDRGRRVESLQYQGDKLRYKIVSTYDDKGRFVETETKEFNAVPNVTSSHAPEPGKMVYTYNDEERTKEVATYGPEGSLKNRIVYTYDERGTQIGRAMFKADGSLDEPVLQFYDNVHEPDGKFRGSLRGKSLFKVEYDSHGNWTKKTYLIQTAKGDKPQPYRAEQRVMTYY